MTKEKLINWVDQYSGMGNVSVSTLNKLLREFFESNVCIPKGEDRHPYADVLHEGIENQSYLLQCRFRPDGKWVDFTQLATKCEYRIKPSEPIYEWQWYSVIDGCVDDTTDTWESKQWLTEKEMITWGSPWHKIEETKRERT